MVGKEEQICWHLSDLSITSWDLGENTELDHYYKNNFLEENKRLERWNETWMSNVLFEDWKSVVETENKKRAMIIIRERILTS